ncbi:nucleolar Jumonji domain interacting protein, putative [Plasmodium gaboni]|uniref:Nucleolar Jumonji domain interacting protein, putative n=1 Tax=Plasmodium gaboni TaxID=647221 RepID=A0ABY1UJ11_9APIC|nr:nucleolar Jumonji domain interacting protein, putative [Plasmodium gaboni]
MNDIYTSIDCDSLIFDIDFHPKVDIVCAGVFDGNIILYKRKEDKKEFKKKHIVHNHEKAVKYVCFSKKGKQILAASSDNSCSITDITGVCIWKNLCHKNSISSILYSSYHTFLTADEIGYIKHWDIRDNTKKPIHKIKHFNDNISSMLMDQDEKSMIVTCGGQLGLFDILYKKKITSHTISNEYSDEFLCSNLMAHNSKIVTTTLNGNISIFSKNPWGNMEAKIKASKDAISTFVKYNDYHIFFGTSDGFIKTAQIQPNKIGETFSKHKNKESIEKMSINKNKNLLATISNDYSINFYQIQINNSIIYNGIKKKKKKSFFHDL